MGKDTINSGIPVFGEVIKMLDKEEIMQIAVKLQADRYTKRLDAYQQSYHYAVCDAWRVCIVARTGDWLSVGSEPHELFRHGLHGSPQYAV